MGLFDDARRLLEDDDDQASSSSSLIAQATALLDEPDDTQAASLVSDARRLLDAPDDAAPPMPWAASPRTGLSTYGDHTTTDAGVNRAPSSINDILASKKSGGAPSRRERAREAVSIAEDAGITGALDPTWMPEYRGPGAKFTTGAQPETASQGLPVGPPAAPMAPMRPVSSHAPAVPPIDPAVSHGPGVLSSDLLRMGFQHEAEVATVLGADPIQTRVAPIWPTADPTKIPEAPVGDGLTDLGITALKGAISVPEAAIGLGDLVSGGRVGQVAEALGIEPGLAKEILSRYYSTYTRQGMQAVEDADGVLDTIAAALQNPNVLAHNVLESVPSMLGGAGVARALPLAPWLAGAVGEGAVSAGSAAEQIRQQTDDGTLSAKQTLLAGGSGAATTALGILGGKIAKGLGIADVDTLLAGAARSEGARRGLVKQIVYGAVQEGGFEELPQSIQEQIAQNRATNRPWEEGVDQAAVMGAFAGAVMGGGTQMYDAAAERLRGSPVAQPADTQDVAPLTPESQLPDTQDVAPLVEAVSPPADVVAQIDDVLAADPAPATLSQQIAEARVDEAADLRGTEDDVPNNPVAQRLEAERQAAAAVPLDEAIRLAQADEAQEREARAAATPPPVVEATTDVTLVPAAPKAGEFYTMRPDEIAVDAARFQFKAGTNAEGVTSAAKIEGPWNEARAGVLMVWKDPADGKTYVVNGHHRLEAAKREGAERVAVRYVDAPTAEKARVEGALTNISEDKGTPLDGAKLIRDAGFTIDELTALGVPAKSALVRDAVGLATLSDPLFARVVSGEIEERIGGAIGAADLTPEGQAALVKVIERQQTKGRTLSPAQVRALAQDVASTPEVKAGSADGQTDIFGLLGDERTQNVAVEKAVLRDWARQQLARDKRLFGFVAKEGRAEELARAGNTIDVEASKAIADEAGQVSAVFDRLANAAGPVSSALNAAAVRIGEGSPTSDVRSQLLADLRTAVAAELGSRPSATTDAGRKSADPQVREGAHRERRPADPEAGQPSRVAPAGARLQIRPTTYRDTPGFQIVGKDPLGRAVKVFTESRGSADVIKARIAAGEDPRAADFKDPAPAKKAPQDVTLKPDREFASTQVNLPADAGRELMKVARTIPDEDLAEDGREDQPHITVKFGLHGNDPDTVRALVANEPPITVRLGKTSIFPNSESNTGDVVKVDVESADLHRLNKKIADALPHTDTHPTYKPHATLAYVKAGLGKKYVGRTDLVGQTFTIDRLVFSGKDRVDTTIELKGKSTSSPKDVTLPGTEGVRETEHATPQVADAPFALKRTTVPRSEQQPSLGLPVAPARTKKAGGSTVGEALPPKNQNRGLPVAEPPPVESSGSPTRAVFDQPPKDIVAQYRGGRPMSEQQAINALRDIFAVERTGGGVLDRITGRETAPLPTRTGKFRQRAFGIYKTETQIIRLKRAFDLATFTHELGHHIDFALFETHGRPFGLFKGELLTLGEATTPDSKRGGEYQLNEGVAEYFRLWFPDPAAAKAAAPTFTAALNDVMRKEAAFADQLHAGQRIVQRYLSQDLATRGKARVSVQRGPSPTRVLANAVSAAREGATGRESATRVVTSVLDTLNISKAARDPHAAWQAFRKRWVDDLDPIQRAERDMITHLPKDAMFEVADGAYALARIARGTAGWAQGFIEYGVRGSDGRFMGGSLRDAIAPVADRLVPDETGRDQRPDFASYLIALRARELTKQGRQGGTKDPGMKRAEADAIIRQMEADPEFGRFEQARDAIYGYQQSLLHYAAEAGVFNAQQLKAIGDAGEFYVPLQRVLDEVAAAGGGTARRIADRVSPVKRLKGSGRDIIDPFESIVKNTAVIVDMVEKNRAMQALVNLADKAEGSAQWLEQVPPGQVATTFNLGQVKTEVLKQLFEKTGISPLEAEVNEIFDWDAMVTAFAPQTWGNPKDRIVTVIRNGTREFYQVQDEALYQAITAIGPHAASEIVQWAAKPTAVLRAGATLTPAFIIRNLMRDTVGAMMQSRHGFVPVYDSLRGWLSMLKKDADWQLYLSSGVQQATLLGQDRDRLKSVVDQLGEQGWRRRIKTIAHPLDAMRALSEQIENATRVGEFKLALDTGGQERRAGLVGIAQRVMEARKARPAITRNSRLTATLAARDVTVDFSRGGSTAKEISQFKAFFNARAQGYARIAESVARDPSGSALTVGALAALSWALWSLNKDDDEYQSLSWRERMDYWWFKLPGNTRWARIPKPHEWGTVPNVMEGVLDQVHHEQQGSTWGMSPVNMERRDALAIVSSLAPTFILPAMEAATNYDTYRRRPIVSPFDEMNLEPEDQYTELTSETMKAVGRAMDLSPAKLQHLFIGYTASAGRAALDVSDTAVAGRIKPRPVARRMEQVPVIGTVVKDASPTSYAQPLQDFYRERGDLQRVKGSYKHRTEKKDAAGVHSLMTDAARFTSEHIARIDAADDAITELRKMRNGIYANPQLTPAQRREALAGIHRSMVGWAATATWSDTKFRNVYKANKPPWE